MTAPPPVVLHVPHAATELPPMYRDQFVLTDRELARELELLTDHHTDILFQVPVELATTVTFPVSRLLVDPERFEDDAHESMAKRGMGVIYERTAHQQPLRRPLTAAERETLLARYYRPHHAALTAAVEAALASHYRCLVIDAHSFPAAPLPYELDQLLDRPDYCIGTDDYHTPAELTRLAVSSFAELGASVAVNRPFAGSIVPMRHYGRDPRVESVMIEVNRALYLDPPDTATKAERFDLARVAVGKSIEQLAAYARRAN